MSELLEKLRSARQEYRSLDYERRNLIKGHIAHELMDLCELYSSLQKHKIFGKTNGNYHKIHDKLIVHICIENELKLKDGTIIRIESSSPSTQPIVFNYKSEEFIKNGLECLTTDNIYLKDMIHYNEWYE